MIHELFEIERLRIPFNICSDKVKLEEVLQIIVKTINVLIKGT